MLQQVGWIYVTVGHGSHVSPAVVSDPYVISTLGKLSTPSEVLLPCLTGFAKVSHGRHDS